MVSPADRLLTVQLRFVHGGLLALLTAVAVLVAVAVAPGSGALGPAVAQAAPGYDRAGDPRPATRKRAYLARITSETDVHAEPSSSSHVISRVKGTTEWGSGTQLLIRGSARTRGDLWLDVRIMGRPNGRHGWIPATAARVTTTKLRILVNRKARTVALLSNGKAVIRARSVIGAKATPTPAGHFAVSDKLQLTHGRAFLGNWVLPLTGYSDVLESFDGGVGQIAIHGRGGASLRTPLGRAASHGCVRMANSAINRIAQRVPIGTPVQIV